IRVEFDRRAQGLNRLVEIFVGQKRIAERGLNVGELRIQFRRLLQFVNRLAQLARLLQREAEVVMRFDVTRFEFYARAQRRDGGVVLLSQPPGHAQAELRLVKIRIELHRIFEFGDGAVEKALLPERESEGAAERG